MKSFAAALLFAATQVDVSEAAQVQSGGLSFFIVDAGSGEVLAIGDEGCIVDSDDNEARRGRRKITHVRSHRRRNRNGRVVVIPEIYTDSESCGESDADSYHSSNTFSDASCNDHDNIPCHFYKGRNGYGKGSGHHW